MAKRKISPEDALIESFAETRQAHPFLSTLSDDGFCGYVTATVKQQYNQLPVSAKELYDLAHQLVKEGRL